MVVCALVWAAPGPRPARAQGGGAIGLRIDCSALDEAAYAALEARARAQLASASTRSSGEVSITCSPGAAVLKWVPADGTWRQQTVPLGPLGPLGEDRSDAVEAILTALDALMIEAPSADAPDAGATAPRSPPPAPPPSPPPPAPSPPPVKPAPAKVPPPAPAPPPAETPAAGTDEAPADRPSSYRVGVTVGADSELWSGGVTAAVGAHAGARLSPARRWSVSAAVGDMWATSAPRSVQSQTLRALVGAGYDVDPSIRLGLAGDVRMMLAQQPSSPASNAATAGLVATARYVARLGSFELSAGPQGEILYRPVIVQVSGEEVLRVPTALVSLSVEGTLDVGAPSGGSP